MVCYRRGRGLHRHRQGWVQEGHHWRLSHLRSLRHHLHVHGQCHLERPGLYLNLSIAFFLHAPTTKNGIFIFKNLCHFSKKIVAATMQHLYGRIWKYLPPPFCQSCDRRLHLHPSTWFAFWHKIRVFIKRRKVPPGNWFYSLRLWLEFYFYRVAVLEMLYVVVV